MRLMRRKPENEKIEGPAAPDDRVQLPSVMGIRPGVYLSFIYILIILAVFFFLCVFPGLSRPGAVVSFRTEPRGAAIRIDGITRGVAPEDLFLDRGLHTVELVLPGFETGRLELEVPGRTLFSLFFPRRLDLKRNMVTADPVFVIREAAADYAAWSFTGEATAGYQIPLSLSEGVYRAGPLSQEEQKAEAEELIRAAARFAVTRASLRDLGRAKLLLDNGGLAPSALSLSRSAADIVSWLSSSPGAAVWLEEILPPESAALVRDSAWAKDGERDGSPGAGDSADSRPVRSFGTTPREIAGIRFFPAWSLSPALTGQDSTAPAFYYAEDPVNAGTWEAFLEARPEWKAENLETLREQRLVNGDYLETGGLGAGGSAALQTGVSWYASDAFCRWLNTRLPPDAGDWEFRLPREDEWEASLAAGMGSTGTAGSALPGSAAFWEWCADPYVPLPSFPAEFRAVEALSSPERLLRGIRRPDSRGSLPPDLCSPFAGFRPFLVPRDLL
jgi:hypothetical protein